MHAVAARVIISLVLGLAARADAQSIPFSQHALVSQRVAYTDLTIEYNRPTARGRVLFGDSGSVVRVGHSWNPGADSATHLTVSRNVTIEGQPLKQGTYALEALAFYFPVVGRDSTVLRMHWGTTIIPVQLRVSREP